MGPSRSSGALITFIVQGVPNAFRDRSRLRDWFRKVARGQGTRIDEVCFVLMGDRDLLRYNRTFLGHNDLTDVITFPVESNNGLAGDILISLDRVKDNAAAFGVSVQQELRRVMVHGVLHLCGHHDGTILQRKAMRALEDRYLLHFPTGR